MLQIMIVLSLVFRVLKNDMKVLLLVQKLLLKTVIYTICKDIDKNNSSDTLSVSLP